MDHEHRSKYRQGDQYVCPACGKAWDVDDTDAPPCITEWELGLKQRKRAAVRKQKRRSATGGGAWSG